MGSGNKVPADFPLGVGGAVSPHRKWCHCCLVIVDNLVSFTHFYWPLYGPSIIVSHESMIVMQIDWEVKFQVVVLVLPSCCVVQTLPSSLTSYPYCVISSWSAWSFPPSGPPPLLLLFPSLGYFLVLLLTAAILVGRLESGDLFVGAVGTECCPTSSGWCWSCRLCGPPPLVLSLTLVVILASLWYPFLQKFVFAIFLVGFNPGLLLVVLAALDGRRCIWFPLFCGIPYWPFCQYWASVQTLSVVTALLCSVCHFELLLSLLLGAWVVVRYAHSRLSVWSWGSCGFLWCIRHVSALSGACAVLCFMLAMCVGVVKYVYPSASVPMGRL